MTLVQALLCPLYQGTWEKGRWSLLASKQVIRDLQHGLSLLVELCGSLGDLGTEEQMGCLFQGADGLGKVQRASVVAFSEKIKLKGFSYHLLCMAAILIWKPWPQSLSVKSVIEDHAYHPQQLAGSEVRSRASVLYSQHQSFLVLMTCLTYS